MASHTTLQVQPSPVPTYNHPCADLLHGGRRSEYLDIVVPLYRASIAGDLEAAKVILQGREYLVRYSINENKETPLHVAVGAGRYNVVSYLVDMMSSLDLELQNRDGNTAFCIAVMSRKVAIPQIMLRKNPALLKIPGRDHMMPLYLAAFHGNHDMVTFLYDQLMLDMTIGEPAWTDDFMDGVFLKCIQADIFDVAQRILKDNIKLPQEKHVRDVLQVLARKTWMFNKINTNPLVSFLVSTCSVLSLRIFSMVLLMRYSKENDATLLLRLLWKRIMLEKPKDVIDEILKGPMTLVKKKYSTDDDIPVIKEHEIETYPSQVLFIAAEMNNTNFLVELIREYPDLVLNTNDDGHTIFHISVYHRHQDIYSLIYETGSMRDPIALMKDHEGNNILHLVGKKLEENNAFKDTVTVTTPFQMFSELLWYKEVAGILPPPCRELKNAAGQTPKELFMKNHEKLIPRYMKTITESINISMVVAALVCTIGFSVAYSIPGGFRQDSGFPMFLHNKYFPSFVVLDVMSFLFSTASIILFLSVTLSSDHGHGDMLSLLARWLVGQSFLLISVFFLVMALISSLRILYLQRIQAYLIYTVTYILTGIYASLCFSLLFDIFTRFDGSYLFGLRLHKLYRKIK